MRARAVPRRAARTGRGRSTLVVVGFLLSCHALTARAPLAEELLRLYEQRLAADRLGGDVVLLEGELKRARAALEPTLRIRQGASVGFTAGPALAADLAASLSIPLSDPEAVAHASLMQRRLELAEHDHAFERSRRLFDFRRTLRLAAHFEEVGGVLDDNRRKLLSLRPEWRELEQVTGISRLSSEELGYLELVDALVRARAELQLLLGSISASTGVREAVLETAGIGRLPPRRPFTDSDASACLTEGTAMRRARLVHLENGAGAATEISRRLPSVRLDLTADVGFDAAAFEPLRAGAQAALQVALPPSPAMAGAAPLWTVTADTERISQEASLSWPAPASEIEPERAGSVDRTFRQAVLDAELGIRRLVASRAAAEATLRLRRLALHSLDSRSGSGAMTGEPPGMTEPFDVGLLVAVARARLAVLEAELDLDLAALELLQSCTGFER